MRLLLALALVAATGCQTLGTTGGSVAPPPPPGRATIYFIRSSVQYGNFWPTIFSVNDTNVVSLHDKGYSWIYLDAGVYKFSTGTSLNNDYLRFEGVRVLAGSVYFIEYNQESAGGNRYRNIVRAVTPEIGRDLIQRYAYKKADEFQLRPQNAIEAPR
jgi:hypothetical protein